MFWWRWKWWPEGDGRGGLEEMYCRRDGHRRRKNIVEKGDGVGKRSDKKWKDWRKKKKIK